MAIAAGKYEPQVNFKRFSIQICAFQVKKIQWSIFFFVTRFYEFSTVRTSIEIVIICSWELIAHSVAA